MRIAVVIFVLCAVALCGVQVHGSHRRTSLPLNALRLPKKNRLLTWNRFTQTLPSKSSLMYGLLLDPTIPPVQRYTTYPVLTGPDSLDATVVYRFEGACYSFNVTDLVHHPQERYAIARNGDYVEAFFSRDPTSYVFDVVCYNVSSIVNNACIDGGALSLFVSQFPPNQLNWGMIVRDLRNVMGLNFLDKRFNFIGYGEACPDP